MQDSPPIGRNARLGRPHTLLWPLGIFAAITVIFALALKSGDPSRLPSALIGKPAPQIALPALEGLAEGSNPVAGFSGADLGHGQVSVVNFWASWCAPCAQEHPLLVALRASTGIRLYGVNYKDQADAARHFLERYGNPYAAVGVDGNGRAAIEWGVYGMPETFVVDGKGLIVFKHVGPITDQSLQAQIIPAIRSATR